MISPIVIKEVLNAFIQSKEYYNIVHISRISGILNSMTKISINNNIIMGRINGSIKNNNC